MKIQGLLIALAVCAGLAAAACGDDDSSPGEDGGADGAAGEGPDVGVGGTSGGRTGVAGSSGSVGAGAGGDASGGTGGGGTGEGGAGGFAGSADAGAGAGGDSAGSGGTGDGGSGGATDGGSGGDGGAGGSGPVACTETLIAPEGWIYDSLESAPVFALYGAEFFPDVGTSGLDFFSIEFWNPDADGADPGTFALGEGLDANYATCSRCVFAAVSDAGQAFGFRDFFAASGTLVIDASSDVFGGVLHATLTDVTFVEVTIDENFVSHPVPGGECLHLANAAIAVE